MPRYYFNMMEGHSQNLVRDIEGAVLADAGEARQEAVGLAQDITSHGLSESTKAWTVVVTDENGEEVMTVPLSEIRARKAPASHEGGHGIGRGMAKLESYFARGAIIWIMAAAAMAIIVQATVTRVRLAQQSGGYQTASASISEDAANEGPIVAIRFKPQASVADVTKFLEAYEASLAGGPRPGNLYRLRIGDTSLPQAELAKIAGRMAQEQVVEFAAAVQ